MSHDQFTRFSELAQDVQGRFYAGTLTQELYDDLASRALAILAEPGVTEEEKLARKSIVMYDPRWATTE